MKEYFSHSVSCGSDTNNHKNPLPLMERSVMVYLEPPFLANVFPICTVLIGDNWHLRRIDWCYEAGEALSQEVRASSF